MTKRILAAVVVLFAALPAGASAHTTIIAPPGSGFPYQRWVDEAKVPTPDVTLTIIETSCPTESLPEGGTAPACTQRGSGTIWFSPTTPAPRLTLFHELGHNFDYTMPDWVRSRFEILTNDTREWTTDPNGPNEHFAMAYSECASTGPDFHGDPGLNVKGNGACIRQVAYRKICRMIDNAT